MRTRQEYIDIIRHNAPRIRTEFGVTSLCLFGSVARGEQREDSDVDVCVDMAPKLIPVMRLKAFLETILGTSVDLVRRHTSLNPFLKSEIDRDAIYLI